MNWTRTERFKIRGYEIGPDQQVPLQNICAYMEEAASLHADELGFSVEELARRGLAWAVTRTSMKFYEQPYLGGDVLQDEASTWVSVSTWPVAVERLQYRRDFLITWQNRVLAKAVTDWVVINLESRQVERVPEFISALQPPNPAKVMESGRLRLSGQEKAPELMSFAVRRADIDRNNHVNNARFAEWLVESVPESVSSSKKLKELQIMYRSESRYGDTVIAKGTAETEEVFLHGLFRQADGRELVRAKSLWG